MFSGRYKAKSLTRKVFPAILFPLSIHPFMTRKTLSAFTLIEMLVVIAIIATIAAFAVPALTSALTKGQMTGTMNNARQLYLAGYQMALDGSSNNDATLAWPGDYAAAEVPSMTKYVEKLIQNDYLKGGDLSKILSAPGSACTTTVDNTANPPTVTSLAPKSAIKVYKVKDADASNTIFAVTANYTYNTALMTTNAPFGDKGFVVIHKGGDGVVLKKNNATSTLGYGGDANKFQAGVGKLTGDNDGALGTEGGTNVLTNP